MKEKYKKPPLGLVPKYIRTEQRIAEIHEAIIRYVEANYVIPIGWLEEYNELVSVHETEESE